MIKLVAEMSLQELAAYVATHLRSRQLPVVLVGGSCVSIYSNNKYQTKDLDFVERYHNQRSLLRSAEGMLAKFETFLDKLSSQQTK
ncbi:MAG: hypothetical protein IPI79_09240 [Moraxellaceae bacterium]|nr:hypothetical protein [Moraxellaceae bacterium]